ncbi:MAG: hypothetical protein AAF921_12310 [Cyanobacteria bacterium P01_D01_bin.44]
MRMVFVTPNVPLQASTDLLRQAIEIELRRTGEPLRWAVTAVDEIANMAQVEAVVIIETT